jgi:hypothetical protein
MHFHVVIWYAQKNRLDLGLRKNKGIKSTDNFFMFQVDKIYDSVLSPIHNIKSIPKSNNCGKHIFLNVAY